MGELAKTTEGRARIAAAEERLDRTVAEMGQQHRADMPQGEKVEVGSHQQDSIPHFIPMPVVPTEVAEPPAFHHHESV